MAVEKKERTAKGMKIFEEMDIFAAYEHAESGGQAVHLCTGAAAHSGAPKCFKKTNVFAHLIDMNIERLKATARRLGVNVIKVGRIGRRGQHIDLCGGPLRKAIELCRVAGRIDHEYLGHRGLEEHEGSNQSKGGGL